MKAVRVAFVVLLSGCLLDNIGGGKSVSSYERTPAGWPVEWRSHGNGHTKEEAYALFDAAMWRAAWEMEAAHGVPAGSVLGRAKDGGVFILVDGWHFPASGVDFPGATWASGLTDGGSNITVALYAKAGGVADAALIPAGAVGVYQGPQTGNWYWGIEIMGQQYPALAYELGHEWGF